MLDMRGIDEKLINKTCGKTYRLEYLGVDGRIILK
jgi:hypothetical protein